MIIGWTFDGMVLLFTITDCTIEITPEGAMPTGSHIGQLVRHQPLKRVAKLLTLFVRCHQGCRGRGRGRIQGAQLVLAPNYHELIHKSSIGHGGVDGGKGEILMLGSKLGKEIRVACVNGMKEEHDLEDGWNGHGRLVQSPQMTLKLRTKLVDTLLVNLSVIEKGKKGSERVGDGRGAEVVFEDLNHFEPLAKVLGVGVLKEVMNRSILEGRADLALLASKGVATISHQE